MVAAPSGNPVLAGGPGQLSHEASRLAWLTKEPQHGARLVLLALADHHNATTNKCFPSVARLVETTRLERKAVIRGIAELERLGVIGTERKNGCHSRYNLHFLDQSQNGTGDKMGPVTKEDSTSPKMGRDRSQNGTRNRERTGKEPGKVLIGEPEERQPDASEAASATNTPPAKKNPATVPPKLRNKLPKDRYEEFLRLYPKRTNLPDKVRKTWLRVASQPHNQEEILADVTFRKTTDDWTKNNGKYVPAPDKYLTHLLWVEPAALIARLTHEIDLHPGNHDSIHHNPQASPEVIADLKKKRIRLNKLRESE
jgi:hypothetical protein